MKYLKLYESYNANDIKSEIMECFYDLIDDDDFNIEIREKPNNTVYFNKTQGPGFEVSINYAPNGKYWSRFKYTKIKPYIDRLEKHIEGYSICLIETTVGHSSIDMSEWTNKSAEYIKNNGLSIDDEIFTECIIYIEKK